MKLVDLKAKIKGNNLDSIYFFVGSDWKVIDIYLQQIEKQVGKKLYYDTVADFMPSLGMGLLEDDRHVFVVRDDGEFMKNETALERLKNSLGRSVFIMILSELDKRTRYYKDHQDIIVEFESLPHDVLYRHIAHTINLNEDNINYLIDLCDGNYGQILLEVDKILTYASGMTDLNMVFAKMVNDGAIYAVPKSYIFDIADLFIKGDKSGCDLILETYASGVSVFQILAIIFNNIQQIAQVSSISDKHGLSETCGLTNYQVKLANERKGYRNLTDWFDILVDIQDIDVKLKTGVMDSSYALQYLFIKWCA